VAESPVRRVVGYIADAMIGRNRGVLNEVDAAEALQAKGVRDPEVAIAEAIRLGLLLRTRLDSPDPFGSRSAVVFPHDHLLQYAFVASTAWTQVTAEAMASAVTAIGPPSLLAGVVQLCITTLDRQQDAIGLQLLRASSAAYAIVAGNGYDQDFADQLPDRVYLTRPGLLQCLEHRPCLERLLGQIGDDKLDEFAGTAHTGRSRPARTGGD
jgi:hypothetical protein